MSLKGVVIPKSRETERAKELEFTLSRIRQKFGQDVFPEVINVSSLLLSGWPQL